MQKFSPIVRSLAFAALVTFLPAAGEYAAAGLRHPGEYDVKAAFLYNFLKFIEWPVQPAGTSSDIGIYILGDVPVSKPFEELQDQSISGRRIVVSRPRSLSSARECTVLFIASGEENRLREILKAVNGSGTLTVGDTTGYARTGVMINFSVVEKRVRFRINAEAARRADIKISSKLLKLADKVYEQVPAGE